jgi:5-methylcytosine-specific restriction endonuclease McrA
MVVLSNNFVRGGRPGGDQRGNAAARRARKGYLLVLWGNGETCPCSYGCGTVLDWSSIEADRIIPGSLGGTYRRENVIPACRSCNVARLDKSIWAFAPKLARKLKRMGFVVSAKPVASGKAV